MLADLGYKSNQGVTSAIKAYQKDNSLKPTGLLDVQTLDQIVNTVRWQRVNQLVNTTRYE